MSLLYGVTTVDLFYTSMSQWSYFFNDWNEYRHTFTPPFVALPTHLSTCCCLELSTKRGSQGILGPGLAFKSSADGLYMQGSPPSCGWSLSSMCVVVECPQCSGASAVLELVLVPCFPLFTLVVQQLTFQLSWTPCDLIPCLRPIQLSQRLWRHLYSAWSIECSFYFKQILSPEWTF